MFRPTFTINSPIAGALMRIEAARQAIFDLPIDPAVRARLRETARLLSSHHSTQIEGNRLTLQEATRVIKNDEHFPDRARDEQEVLGYSRALDEIAKRVAANSRITEKMIQRLHAMVMGGREGRVRATPYRVGQNVIRVGSGGAIVYLPPEAADVPALMADLVKWLETSSREGLPCPLRAAIAHYQYATIHPYYDGNGRSARLLATLVLHLGGYDLKGFYSLEEYYTRDLRAYYRAISVGPSHNYYEGRASADITSWLEYFSEGMAHSFESVQRRTREAARARPRNQSKLLRQLDARQRRVLELFVDSGFITSSQVARLFGLKPRTARDLCRRWVAGRLLCVVDRSKKARKYGLTARYRSLVLG